MFITLLIIVVASLITTNANTGVSLCNQPNDYSWKVYEIVVSKSSIRQGETCADEFTERGNNIQYCYSNSIQTMNMIQKGNIKQTAIGSGDDSTADNRIDTCQFHCNFIFDKGTILGGDIAIYKYVETNDTYQLIAYNELIDKKITIGSTIASGRQGWQRIQINEFSRRFGTGKFTVKLSIQFNKNNVKISCQEAQSIFYTDCSISNDPFPPALVLLSQRASLLYPRKRTTTKNSINEECKLKKSIPSMKGLHRQPYNIKTVDEVDIRMCINNNGQRCVPKQTRDLHLMTKKNINSMTIHTIPTAIKC